MGAPPLPPGPPPSPGGVEPARRPYKAPRLVRLGSVRKLMLGQSAGFPEGAGTFIKPGM